MAGGLTRSSPDDPLLSLVDHEALHPAPIMSSTPASAAMAKNWAAPRWEVGVALPLAVFKDQPSDNALRPVPPASCHPWLSPCDTMIITPLSLPFSTAGCRV